MNLSTELMQNCVLTTCFDSTHAIKAVGKFLSYRNSIVESISNRAGAESISVYMLAESSASKEMAEKERKRRENFDLFPNFGSTTA